MIILFNEEVKKIEDNRAFRIVSSDIIIISETSRNFNFNFILQSSEVEEKETEHNNYLRLLYHVN